MGYAPLDFLNTPLPDGSTTKVGDGFKELKEVSVKGGFYLPDDEDEVLRFALSTRFLDESYDGEMKGFNDYAISMLSLIPDVLSSLQTEEEKRRYKERIKQGIPSVVGDARDMFVSRIIFDKWARNKQVYKLDGMFAKVLGNTDKFSLTRSMLNHLPTDCFYLDLENANCFGPVHGVFVFVLFDGPVTNIACYILHESGMFFSDYLCGIIDDAGEVLLGEETWEAVAEQVDGICYRRILATVLQFFSYLSVKEPDVAEDPVTRSTYRKPTVVKNKFSEVQRYEVGVRIGKALTIKEDEWKKSTGESEPTFVSEKENVNAKQRKSPRPYIRCAHWQRYHTGKGRANVELRWKEPVFCGANGKEIDTDVVVHKVCID